MKGTIKISAPYVEQTESDIFGPAVRLAADVEMINPNTGVMEKRPLFFEFERRYEEYLCPERSDAFVMGLLSTAMENDCNIEFKTPMTDRLFYQMNDDYLPMMAKYNANFPLSDIRLSGPVTSAELLTGGGGYGVATGCSCGVDSLYTVYKKTHCSVDRYNLTHLFCHSCGTLDCNEERIKALYTRIYRRVENLSAYLGLEACGCWTNIHTFYKFPYKIFCYFYTTTAAGCVFALQKLFSVYYESSSYTLEQIHLEALQNYSGTLDGSMLDIYTLPCMNTDTLTFYSAGTEATRIEKQEAIADYPAAQKFLSVCGIEYDGGEIAENKYNCSRCEKCVRTMTNFYAINKLDNFAGVFDVQDYKANFAKRLGRWMGICKKHYIHDLMPRLRQNNIKIPFGARVYALLFWRPYSFLKKKLRNSRFMRRLYYKFNIDKKIHGYRSSVSEAYKDLM